MTDPARSKPWQYTWVEFLGEPTEREGGLATVFPEMSFDERPIADAAELLHKVMGPSFERARTLSETELPDGRRFRIATADDEGARLFAGIVANPDSDACASNLMYDEEYGGPHYLLVGEPPLVLLQDALGTPPRLVGWFYGDILRVDEEIRGLGFGKAMVMAAAEIRGGLPLAGHGSNYSESGYQTMRAAHREFVRRALLDGEDVPENVLADYPELAISPLSP